MRRRRRRRRRRKERHTWCACTEEPRSSEGSRDKGSTICPILTGRWDNDTGIV